MELKRGASRARQTVAFAPYVAVPKLGVAPLRQQQPCLHRVVRAGHRVALPGVRARLVPVMVTAPDGGSTYLNKPAANDTAATAMPMTGVARADSAVSVAGGGGGSPIDGAGGGGSGGGGSGGSGGGGGDGAGDEASGGNEENVLARMMQDRGMTLQDFPADIQSAYSSGIIGANVLINFLHARGNIFSRVLMQAGPGMRNRFLADRLFLLKIAIEEGMGIAGKLGAEYERRRERFWVEKEFVLANLITALLADFALVYLPAPSVALKRATSQSTWLQKISAGLPSNIFQTDRPFTLAQRAGGFTLKAAQLFVVGFACSLIGVAMTNGCVMLRERFDDSYKPETQKTNVLAVSGLYATFLGLSSGSRYQLVNGIESHIFPRIFAKSPQVFEQLMTFLLRYGNTFWGSQQWVIFCRMTGVQKVKTDDK